jgi:hypothetical protein
MKNIRLYWGLAKPRILSLVLVTTTFGSSWCPRLRFCHSSLSHVAGGSVLYGWCRDVEQLPGARSGWKDAAKPRPSFARRTH